MLISPPLDDSWRTIEIPPMVGDTGDGDGAPQRRRQRPPRTGAEIPGYWLGTLAPILENRICKRNVSRALSS